MNASEREPPHGFARRLSWRTTTLDRYVLGRFLGIYAANLLSFTLLFVLIDLVSNIERFQKNADGFGDFVAACFAYYTSIVPVIFCQILGPVVAVASAMFTVTLFQRSNEFVPVLAAGRSYQRTLLPILVASAVMSVGTFVIQEAWIPRTADAIRQALERKGRRVIFDDVKYRDAKHGNLIILKAYNRVHQSADEGVLVLPVEKRGRSQYLIAARSMEWRTPEAEGDNYWLLRDVRVQEYDQAGRLVVQEPEGWEGAPPRLDRYFAERRLETSLTPEYIELLEEESVYMSLADLSRQIGDSPDSNRWLMKYMARFSAPATNFLLVLLGVPIIICFGNRNIFVGALAAIVVATLFLFFDSVFQEFGVRGHLPVRVSAWIVPSFFAALGLTFYREMRG